jgi:hypothetical protein
MRRSSLGWLCFFIAVIQRGLSLLRSPLGQAERVIGDHDRNTLRLRLDPKGEPAGLEPGMTVWIEN